MPFCPGNILHVHAKKGALGWQTAEWFGLVLSIADAAAEDCCEGACASDTCTVAICPIFENARLPIPSGAIAIEACGIHGWLYPERVRFVSPQCCMAENLGALSEELLANIIDLVCSNAR